MSYNGKVFNATVPELAVEDRRIDIEIPNEVMKQLYIPIDGKVWCICPVLIKSKYNSTQWSDEQSRKLFQNGASYPFIG